MKRKNLFLTLISSILVTIAIVTVTVCSVLDIRKNKNNVSDTGSNGQLEQAGTENNDDNTPKVDDVNTPEEPDEPEESTHSHDWAIDWSNDETSHWHTCSGCDEVSDKTEHVWNDGEVTTPATEEAEGKKTYTCTVCGKTKTEVIAKITANFDELNETERDGSEAKPYILYSAENFNNMIKLYGGVDGNHFELVNDIDFAGKKVSDLFTKKTTFNGVIEGNGYSLKNITIDVDENNLAKYTYDKVYKLDDGTKFTKKHVRVALFGTLGTGTEIKNLKIENLNVTLADEVYDIVVNDDEYVEVVIAGLASYAFGTKIDNVDFTATVNGFSMLSKKDTTGKVVTFNSLGGMFAVEKNVQITNSNITSTINVNKGIHTCIAGISGYGYETVVKDSVINTTINTTATLITQTAGAIGFAREVEMSNLEVNFTLNENDENYVSSYTDESSINAISVAAGLVAHLRASRYNADSDTLAVYPAKFTNIRLNSKVNFDCAFSGVVMDVYSDAWKATDAEGNFFMTKDELCNIVRFEDVIIDADVNVLAVHAFARQLFNATIYYDYSNIDSDPDYFNIRIDGSIKLNSYKRTGTIASFNIWPVTPYISTSNDNKSTCYVFEQYFCLELSQEIEDLVLSNNLCEREQFAINSYKVNYSLKALERYKVIAD